MSGEHQENGSVTNQEMQDVAGVDVDEVEEEEVAEPQRIRVVSVLILYCRRAVTDDCIASRVY